MNRMSWGRALAVALVTLAVACGAPDQTQSSPQAPAEDSAVLPYGDPTQYSGTVRPSGPGMESHLAIDQVLATLGAAEVLGIEPDAVPAEGNSNLPGLRVSVSALDRQPGARVRRGWLGNIAAGAVADLMRADEVAISQVIDRVNVIERFPSGRSKDLGGGLGYVAAGQVFDAQTTEPDDDAITEHVIETLRDFGLTATSVKVLHPLGPAVLVVAALPDNAIVDWTLDELRDAISGDPYAYEGVSIEIDSASGTPLIVSAVAYRTGSGGGWWADGQDDVFGYNHGGPNVHQ